MTYILIYSKLKPFIFLPRLSISDGLTGQMLPRFILSLVKENIWRSAGSGFKAGSTGITKSEHTGLCIVMTGKFWRVKFQGIPGQNIPDLQRKIFLIFSLNIPSHNLLSSHLSPDEKKNPNNLAFSSLLLPVKQLQSEVRSAHVLTEELWNGTVNGNSQEIALQKKSLKYLQWKELCHNCKHVRSMFFTELCWILLTLLSSNWVNCLFSSKMQWETSGDQTSFRSSSSWDAISLNTSHGSFRNSLCVQILCII